MAHQAFLSVPSKKLVDALEETVANCPECSSKGLKINSKLCTKCSILNKRYHRFSEANIPVIYWNLEMELHFTGDDILKQKYLELTNDLKATYKKGTALCFAGTFGTGKQLALDTELPTPNGFIKLNELQVGDKLFDENGDICTVLQLHPINVSPESYEIEFDDGTKVKACADHKWLTHTRRYRAKKQKKYDPKVISTKEIYDTLRNVDGAANHSIPCCKPLNYAEKKLLIDPYVLGCWLGDGNTANNRIECADVEILKNINKNGYSTTLIKNSNSNSKSKSRSYRIGDLVCKNKKDGSISNVQIGYFIKQLKELNLIQNKHIPNDYLFASYEQRLALLQGLMDTDGSCTNGSMEFCSVLPELACQVLQLIRSLGIKCNIRKNSSFLYGVRHKDRYRLSFTTTLPVFKLKRKLNNILLIKKQLSRTTHRFITNIKRIDPVPMRCITVDSKSHLFLITRAFIATHNTTAVCNILKRATEKNYSALYVNLNDIVTVMLNAAPDDKIAARRELLTVDFLAIDEFDPRYMANDKASDLFGKILEDVFRTRSQNGLPLLMCTNAIDVVSSFTGAIKQSIGSLMNTVSIIPVLGKDHRVKAKK